jgi:hypothetical protein
MWQKNHIKIKVLVAGFKESDCENYFTHFNRLIKK